MRTGECLHFFLRDGTVEVKKCKRGVQPSNLLNRSKLPKDTFFNPDTPMYDANQPKAVSWEDLRCGSTIMVWAAVSAAVVRPRRNSSTSARASPRTHAGRGGQGAAFPKTLPPYSNVGRPSLPWGCLAAEDRQSTTDEFKRWQMADNKVLRFEMGCA